MTNEAPETIYLQWTGSEFDNESTWCSDQINDDDIEYVKIRSANHLELLRRCEWISVWNGKRREYRYTCPICESIKEDGHADYCELAEALSDENHI